MKVLSEEHKKKISDSMKNRVLSEKHKQNIKNSKIGKRFSEEHKENLSQARVGKKYMTRAIVENYILAEINEEKSVVLAFGRMNPPTVGHEKLVKKIQAVAKEKGATAQLYVSHTQDAKKNPLDYDEKISFLKKAFGSIVKKSDDRTILHILKTLNGKFDKVYIIAGSDRVAEFAKLVNTYNGRDYKFDSIEVVSAGERDADSDDAVSSMSASKLRSLAASGDFDTFKSGLPVKLQKYAKIVYTEIRNKMNIKEEYLDEAEGLWKFNKRSGMWDHQRAVTPETKDQWLKTFKDDEPNEHFVISKNKPNKKPSLKESAMNINKFSKSQLDALIKNYATIKTIDPDSPTYKKMTDMLDKMPEVNLQQLVDAKVPWLGKLAANRIRTAKNTADTKKTFPNVKHVTKDGHPDWEKHGVKEEAIEEGKYKTNSGKLPKEHADKQKQVFLKKLDLKKKFIEKKMEDQDKK